MTRFILSLSLVAVSFLAFVSDAQAGVSEATLGATTQREYTINYNINGGVGAYTASDVDYITQFYPSESDSVCTFLARGMTNTSQNGYRTEIGSGTSFSLTGYRTVNNLEVRSRVETTQRFYLSDDDGDGQDDIDIILNLFQHGDLAFYNPYYTAEGLDVHFFGQVAMLTSAISSR